MASKRYDISWFDPERRKPSPPDLGYTRNLIAKLFFRTNERILDRNDIEVLHRLASYVVQELAHGRTVELSLVGKADYRGRATYNKWLSEQRAKAVAERLGRFVGQHPNFTCVWLAGLGEELAVQAAGKLTPDRYLMENDRIVEVWWGLPAMHFMPEMRQHCFPRGAGGVSLTDFSFTATANKASPR